MYIPDSIQVEERSNWPFIITLVICLLVASGWAYKETVVDRPLSEDRELHPGYNILDKWPFIIHVKFDKLVVLKETPFNYEFEIYDQIVIPTGYCGVLTKHDGTIEPEVLKPGIYKFNLSVYHITLVDTSVKTYIYE